MIDAFRPPHVVLRPTFLESADPPIWFNPALFVLPAIWTALSLAEMGDFEQIFAML